MPKCFQAALALAVITLSAIASPPALAERLKVVATFTVIADMAKNVGGDRVEITTLVGPNGDTHVYEPRPADVVAMAKADVVLVNGLHFEGFLERLIETSATKGRIVELTRGITPIAFEPDGFSGKGDDHQDHDHAAREGGGARGHHDHDAADPHAFQSIPNAQIYVKNIADAFCAADRPGCAEYRRKASAYTETLKSLDAEIRAAVAQIPADRRVVITSHDAFGYLAHEYGLTFLAPAGLSTDAEPSAAHVAVLVKQIQQEKAAAVFLENIANPRLIEQIAAETGVKVGGMLYSDSLSEKDGPAPTYIDMIRNNITQIKGAILGS